MHKNKFKIILILIFAITGTSIAKRIEFDKKEFTISFPELWKEIPRDALDEYHSDLVKQLPNVQHKQIYYGFQLFVSLRWFDYPYILITMHDNGRLSKRQLMKMSSMYKPVMDEQIVQRRSLINDVDIGEMYYNEKSNIIWMCIESDVKDVGPVSVVSAFIPTEKGFIQVVCSSLKKDYKKYESAFQSVIMSVKPNPELVYIPRWSDKLPPFILGINWITVLGKGIDVAIIGAIVVILIKWKNKKKKKIPIIIQIISCILIVFTLIITLFIK